MLCFPLNLVTFFVELRRLAFSQTEEVEEERKTHQIEQDALYAQMLQQMENTRMEQNSEDFPRETHERESLIVQQERAYHESLQIDMNRV
jgi:hypothetical protein